MRETRNPYLNAVHFESDSGVSVQMKTVWEIANKALTQIVSELPEEARTHDVVKRVLTEASQQLNGIAVKL